MSDFAKDANVPINDTISRQAAIDAVCEYCEYFKNEKVIQRIKEIPSVQPEEVARDIATIIENEKDMRVILKNAQQMWIPVTEALPNDGVEVWVTIKGHDVIRCEEGETLEQAIARISKIRWVTQGYWSEEEHGWNDPSFGCPLMVKPVAWMPMEVPDPWQGGQDD